MEEQELPIVPFGKYKNKPVTELMADKNYVDWLKNQSWFSNNSPIYNIVVNQTINNTNNSKTPEHNKLQNLFLDKKNQLKLLSKLTKSTRSIHIDKINNALQNEDFVRCFGENVIPEFINKLDNTKIKFEGKFNWDLVIDYRDDQTFTIVSKSEIEIVDKKIYKEQYDIKEKEKYKNILLLFDTFIEALIKFEEETSNLQIDEKEVQTIVKKELERRHIRSFADNMECYNEVYNRERKNAHNNEVIKAWNNNSEYEKILKDLRNILENNRIERFQHRLCSYGYKYTPDEIKKVKEEYKNDYIKSYENKFIEHYKKYRLQYYNDILKKHNIDSYSYVGIHNIKNTNENQYKIRINICNYCYNIRCELKPTLSDEYPCVLRKLQTQIELTRNDKKSLDRGCRDMKTSYGIIFILLIESFTSKYTSKEELITIFKQHNIRVIFTNEIFETSKSIVSEYVNTHTISEQLLLDNKILKDNLLQTEQKLLKAEEKINQLEQEILSLKSQSQRKNVNQQLEL